MNIPSIQYTRQRDEVNFSNNVTNGYDNNIFYIQNDPSLQNVSQQTPNDLPIIPVEPPPQRREKFDIIQCILCTLLFFLLLSAIIMTFFDNGGPYGGLNFYKYTTQRPRGTTPMYYNYTLPPQINCGVPQYPPNAIDTDVKFENKRDINNRLFKRIINGREAMPHSWPWMVSIKTKRTESHFCDGFLIYDNIVLTAAHCLEDKSAYSIEIVVGLHELDNYQEEQIYYAESIAIHELYDSVNIVNDIGIIKLRNPVEFSDEVSTICLPESETDANSIDGENVILAGWGRIDKDTSNILATTLQETILQIKNGYLPCFLRDYNSNLIYCAVDPKDAEDSNACNGDSGSPLFIKKNDKWYAYGITSYITGMNANNNEVICLPSDPSFYTKLPIFLKWIAWKIKTM